MEHQVPEWFTISEIASPQVMRRISESVSDLPMAHQVRSAPMLAHWFMLDSLLLANQANRDGMHANALALLRQCIEAISIVELGVCGHTEAEAKLTKWDADKLSPGKLRGWLENSVWPQYGDGLWTEPWSTFMREFTAAVQPYAHYGTNLAQWQVRLVDFSETSQGPDNSWHGLIEMKPRAYD